MKNSGRCYGYASSRMETCGEMWLSFAVCVDFHVCIGIYYIFDCTLVCISRLYNNGLKPSCAESLALALNANRSMTELDLGFNELGDSGLKLVFAALRNPDCKLQKLRLVL